jgi:hypothetical protein
MFFCYVKGSARTLTPALSREEREFQECYFAAVCVAWALLFLEAVRHRYIGRLVVELV